MVKHWRRSHRQPGQPQSPGTDDGMSDSASGSSPATPESHAAMPWRTNEMPMLGHPAHQLQRAASFADFGQHISSYGLQQPYNHRHSLSSSGAADFHGASALGQAAMHHQQQHQQQPPHPGVQILQRTGSLPHTYFVPDQNNPGVATMSANPHPAQQAHQYHPQHHHQQVPRQGVERLPLEIPAYPNAAGLHGSMPSSSPSGYSAASGRSPSTQQDGFYTHAAPGQTAAYSLHAPSPVEQQQQQQQPQAPQQMMGYPAQLASPQAAATIAAQQAAMTQAAMTQAGVVQHVPTPAEHPHHAHHHHHQHHPHHHAAQQQQQQHQQEHQQQAPQQWYDGVEYQSPVEVSTIGSLPPFGSGGLYDQWGPKLEFDDPTMQLPSARIASL